MDEAGGKSSLETEGGGYRLGVEGEAWTVGSCRWM